MNYLMMFLINDVMNLCLSQSIPPCVCVQVTMCPTWRRSGRRNWTGCWGLSSTQRTSLCVYIRYSYVYIMCAKVLLCVNIVCTLGSVVYITMCVHEVLVCVHEEQLCVHQSVPVSYENLYFDVWAIFPILLCLKTLPDATKVF